MVMSHPVSPVPRPSSSNANASLNEAGRAFVSATEMYKSRVQQLEEEVATYQASSSVQQLEIQALEAKMKMLLECYREIDQDLQQQQHDAANEDAEAVRKDEGDSGHQPSYSKLVLRCAELQHQVNALRQQTDTRVQHCSGMGVKSCCAVGNVPERGYDEVVGLLKRACVQLAGARAVGSKLLVELDAE